MSDMAGQMKIFIEKHHRCLILALIVLSLQVWSVQKSMDQIRAKSLFGDYDGYWHLVRVQEIHRSGSWDNEINLRGNAPFGERLHWTHAMDLVLWAGASIGSLFTDFNSSLRWWGVSVGPVFYVLSLIAIALFGPALVGRKYVMHLVLLFLLNLPQLLVVYAVNRPDHHCLVAFAYVLYYCLFVVLLERPDSARVAVFTGVLGALGLWCGLEIFVLVGLSVLYLGLVWLLRGEKYLKANYLLALSLSIGLMITIVLDEKPSHWWVVAYDKRSIVHVSLFFFTFLFWLGEVFLARTALGKTVGARLTTAVGGGVLVLLPCLILFPEFIRGPMARVDPMLYPLYLDKTGEFGAMIARRNVPQMVYNILLVLPGFIYLTQAAYRNVRKKRILFSWLAVTICVYSALMFPTPRWVYTLQFVGILPTTFLLIALWEWERTKKHPVLAVAATVILLCAPYGAMLPLRSSKKAAAGALKDYNLKLVALLSFIESEGHASPGEIILANVSIGPAIMYHTSLDAVGTLNHHNDRGIIDTYRIVNAEDDAAARELMEARGIDYLLVDEPLREFARFGIDSSCESKDVPAEATFLGRLGLGQIPDWLVKMPLPEELAGAFTLYRVASTDARNG